MKHVSAMVAWILMGVFPRVILAQTAGPASPTPPGTVSAYPACTREPTKSEGEAAHAAYTVGRASFDEADYDTAIVYFRDSYRRDCTKHLILDILSRAYELKPDLPNAVDALETYLKRVSASAEGYDAAQRRLEVLRKRAAAVAAAKAVPTPLVVPATRAVPPPGDTDHTATAPPKSEKNFPWVLIGVGSVAFVGGAVVAILGAGEVGDARDMCPDDGSGNRACPPNVDAREQRDRQVEGNRLVVGGIITAGVGALATVGGLYWHVSARKKKPVPPRADVVLLPTVARGVGGVTLVGEF